ncbi:MAG: tubulin/FtsZ family protein [Halobacteriales archaeon]|nr:tubulin/FtsZ family protein [Halobacteriales archaeon]
MKLALIGFGQAGGKIVDKLLEYDKQTGSNIAQSAIAINSAKADLMGLEYVPMDNRVLIGQARVKGHGVGADNELGAEIAQEDVDEMQGAIDSVPVHEIDAFLVIAALGGGTGSGGAPVLARQLKRIYTEPVYGFGVLPSGDEGGIYTLNAARSFQTFVRETDNLIMFDNDAWRRTGESVEGGYDKINAEIVHRLGVLFGAGEISAGAEVGQSVVDSSEIINTLSGGGISTIGYATEGVESDGKGLLERFSRDDDLDFDSSDTTNRITSLIRKAVLGRLTLPCEIQGAERALVVVSGPPEHLNRKGIERGRQWIEEETGSMEVRGGDYPLPNEQKVAAAVMLSGVSNAPRIKELQKVAIEAQDNIEAIRAEREELQRQLIDEGTDELDPLF